MENLCKITLLAVCVYFSMQMQVLLSHCVSIMRMDFFIRLMETVTTIETATIS